MCEMAAASEFLNNLITSPSLTIQNLADDVVEERWAKAGGKDGWWRRRLEIGSQKEWEEACGRRYRPTSYQL